MMIAKKLYLTLIALLLATVASAGATSSKLSPATRAFLQAQSLTPDGRHKAPAAGSVQCFIELSQPHAIARLKSAGVQVNARFNGFVTASVPIGALGKIADVPGVSYIDVAGRAVLATDTARSQTHVDQVLSGTGLKQPYDGTGVIIGMVDSGIDFTHPAFKTASGVSRIKRVYQPLDSAVTPLVIGTDTLPGREYTTPGEIALLTTDDTTLMHGTHTTGIAAGTRFGPYSGMAPGADLVLCSMRSDSLTFVNIANSLYYIAHYAQAEQRPCVINMSLGTQAGPHDGTGYLSRVIDDISASHPGVTVVLSAGNDGLKRIYNHKKFTAADNELRMPIFAGLLHSESEIDAWNRTSDTVRMQLRVVDRHTGQVVYSTGVISADTLLSSLQDTIVGEAGDTTLVLTNPVLGQYFLGTVLVETEINPINHKGRMYMEINTTMTNNDWRLAVSYFGNLGTEIDTWDQSMHYVDLKIPGTTEGTDSISVGDLATTRSAISVGAYTSRTSHPSLSGDEVTDALSPYGWIAYFSSWGTDLKGDVHPFITAPGYSVVSAYNSYYHNDGLASQLSQRLDVDGRSYYWGANSGTSMAAPCVTGIIALWLQANPELSRDDIKRIMRESAIVDSFVTLSSNPKRWGNGKIDAYAGIVRAMASSVDATGLSGNTQVALFPNPARDVVTVTYPATTAARLAIYTTSGILVRRTALPAQRTQSTLDVSALTPGLYLLQLDAGNTHATLKLLKQ